MAAAMRFAARATGLELAVSSKGASHASISTSGSGPHDGPHLDAAGLADANGLMHGRHIVGGQAAACAGVGEDLVHRRKDVERRAEGMLEVDRLERLAGGKEPAPELAAHAGELGRRRSLEGEDRLLLVADREDRARSLRAGAPSPAVNSAASRSTICHCFGLVSCASSIEDVVDAAVKLVEHPFGAGTPQEVKRPGDEIVEVERGHRGFLRS